MAICQFLVRESLKVREGDSGLLSDTFLLFRDLAKKPGGILRLLRTEHACGGL